MGLRVRWSAAAKGALLVGSGLLALFALPGLLKPPEPPPLPADVGLPRVAVETPPERQLGRVASVGDGLRSPEAAEGRASQSAPLRPSARRGAGGKDEPPPRQQDPPAVAVPPLEPP